MGYRRIRGVQVAFAVAITICAGSAIAADAPTAKKTVAVLPFKVTDIQLNDAERMNSAVRKRAGEAPWLALQEEDLTNTMVEAGQSLGVDCADLSPACAIEIGRIANAELVVTAEAIRRGNEVGVRFRLTGVDTRTTSRQVFGLLPAETALLDEAIDEVAQRFFKTEAPTYATLTLPVETEGAVVWVDGFVVENFEGTVNGLEKGAHTVRVEAPGFMPAESRFGLAEGMTYATVMPLQLIPPPPEASNPMLEVFPWVVAGGGSALAAVGAVGMVGGAIPGILFISAQQALASLSQTNLDDPVARGDAAAIASVRHSHAEAAAGQWNSWGQITLVLGGAGMLLGGATAAGGVAWALTAAGAAPTSESE